MERTISPQALHDASRLALQLRNVLDASGAQLALVGRIGSDVSKYGIKYTHVGFVLRDHPKGRWLFVHVLNRCGTDSSAIYDQGLINFFTDDPYKLEAVVVIPSVQLQERLKRVILSPLADRLHQPHYSAIAYPFADSYQNSNQWPLTIIAAAQAGEGKVDNRRQAQDYLTSRGYEPGRIPIAATERVGATLFRANVHFLDHPLSERLQGQYQVVTAESIIRYLEKTDKGVTVKEIELKH
ncbi:MAG: DUF2145 domain-containing protein [Candidatus Competibacteraceae bacterium]